MSAVLTIWMSTLEKASIGAPASCDVVADASLMPVAPKSASDVSEQDVPQSSGRSMIHSADDRAAEKVMPALA